MGFFFVYTGFWISVFLFYFVLRVHISVLNSTFLFSYFIHVKGCRPLAFILPHPFPVFFSFVLHRKRAGSLPRPHLDLQKGGSEQPGPQLGRGPVLLRQPLPLAREAHAAGLGPSLFREGRGSTDL